MVRKKIQQIGTSYGIIIPKIFFEDMEINPVLDSVELEVRNKILHVKKAETKKD